MIDGSSLHVYPRGEPQHIASMDCWCEPRLWGHLEGPESQPTEIILHADLLAAAIERETP